MTASEVHGNAIATTVTRGRGRPTMAPEERKKQVTIRLSPGVLSAARNTGPGWQARVDDVLRAVFVRSRKVSARELGEAISHNLKEGARATSRVRSSGPSRSTGRSDEKKRA